MVIHKKTIFVVDDEEVIGQSLESILKETYNVQVFTEGKKALDAARVDRPDCVILDFFLPGENTPEIIRSLRNISESLAIIIMSANMGLIQNKDTLPVQDFIEKPFQIDTIFGRLAARVT